jgi:protoporphyrinogen oxidase
VSGAPENFDLPGADQVYTKDVKTVSLMVSSRRGFGADSAVHTHSVKGKESEKGAEDGGSKPVDEIPSSPSQALDEVGQ